MTFLTNHPVVDAVDRIMGAPYAFGNFKLFSWYDHVQTKNKRGQFTDYLALDLLGDIVYWYRSQEVRDEVTGNVIGLKKKFAEEKLQRSPEAFAKRFKSSVKVIRQSLKTLEEIEVISIERKPISTTYGTLPNVMYISLNVDVLQRISTPVIEAAIPSKSLLPKSVTSDLDEMASLIACCPNGIEGEPKSVRCESHLGNSSIYKISQKTSQKKEDSFFDKNKLLQQEEIEPPSELIDKPEKSKEDSFLKEFRPVADARHTKPSDIGEIHVSQPIKNPRRNRDWKPQDTQDYYKKRGFEASALGQLGIWEWSKYASDPIAAARMLGEFQTALETYFRDDGRTEPSLLTNTILKHMRERNAESTHWGDWLSGHPLWTTEKQTWGWIDPQTGKPNPYFLQDRLIAHMTSGGGNNSSLDRVEAAKRAAKEMAAQVDGGAAAVNLMYENWMRRLDRKVSEGLDQQANGSLSAGYLRELSQEEPIEAVKQRLSGNVRQLLSGTVELQKVHSLGVLCGADSNAVLAQAKKTVCEVAIQPGIEEVLEEDAWEEEDIWEEEAWEEADDGAMVITIEPIPSPKQLQSIQSIHPFSPPPPAEVVQSLEWDAERLKMMKILQGFLNRGMSNGIFNMQPAFSEWKLQTTEGIILPMDEKPTIEYLTFLLEETATKTRISRLITLNGWWGYCLLDNGTIEEY